MKLTIVLNLLANLLKNLETCQFLARYKTLCCPIITLKYSSFCNSWVQQTSSIILLEPLSVFRQNDGTEMVYLLTERV